MLHKVLTRDQLRFLAAGKYVHMNLGAFDFKQMEVFVEGFFFATDLKLADETVQNKVHVGTITDDSFNNVEFESHV